MKVTELRIGNYVNYNKANKELGIVSEIKTSVIPELEYIGINNRVDIYYLIKHIESIPITQEYLIKFGFEIIKNEECIEAYFKDFRYSLFKDNDKEVWLLCDQQDVLIDLKYIHTLQNIWWLLTNKELTL